MVDILDENMTLKNGGNASVFKLYQLDVILYCLFYPLRLNADVSLRSGTDKPVPYAKTP